MKLFWHKLHQIDEIQGKLWLVESFFDVNYAKISFIGLTPAEQPFCIFQSETLLPYKSIESRIHCKLSRGFSPFLTVWTLLNPCSAIPPNVIIACFHLFLLYGSSEGIVFDMYMSGTISKSEMASSTISMEVCRKTNITV